jgi:peptidyl-prolyl cis-trans isomerase D
MGMMTRMRDHAHVFIIAFAVVFIAFWVISDINPAELLRGSRNEIGNIDGKSITYQEYQDMVEQVIKERKKENPTMETDENAIASVREQIWGDYITRAVIDHAVKDLNISVTDQEINDWVRSDNPPEVLAKYFRDSTTGTFNRENYMLFLSKPEPANREAMIQIEKQLKDELTRTKLTTALSGAIHVSEQDLRNKFIDQNLQLSASYVYFDPRTLAAKDTAAPTEQEYKDYYERNLRQFKTKELRKVKYVLFPEIPSSSDSNAIRNELNALADEARGGADFLELVKNSSEQQYQDQWFGRQMMGNPAMDKLFSEPVGSIVGPLATETGYSIYKILDQRQGTETLNEASHILFRTDGGQDDATQKQKAMDALQKAKSGQDFGALAAKLSEEPGASERKGALGWFGKGRMVPEFETAVNKAKIGEIVGPVKTQFGYHVIKVTARSAQEIKYAELRMSIKASAGTRDDLLAKARDFAYLANDKSLEEEAKYQKMKLEETPEFAKQSGSYIPNIGVNPALLKFAFENKIGTISDVFRASNGYVVCMVSDKRPEGHKPLEDVREQIKPQVVADRQMRKTLEIAANAQKGRNSLQEIAASRAGLTVSTTGSFSLSAGAPGVGRDEAFNGTLLGMKEGQISKPIRGMRGVFIVQLQSKGGFDETAFKVKKSELRQQTLSQIQNEFIQSWLEQMKDKIKVVDNRDRFYR